MKITHDPMATCSFMIPNFPRGLKDRYTGFLKANGVKIRDHMEYLIAKVLRDEGVDIPAVEIESVAERIRERRDKMKGGRR